jgi:hypothetical protein
MTLFAVLAQYLSSKEELTLSPHFEHLGDAKEFTITNGVHTLSLKFIDEKYIHYRDPSGTPNEIFKIEDATPGHLIKLIAKHHDPMTIDQLGDYLVEVLADPNLPVSRRSVGQ